MITLHLGIGSGDVVKFEFDNEIDFIDYVYDCINSFESVWLFACNDFILVDEDGFYFNVMAREEIEQSNALNEKNIEFHLHEYPTYTDAYAVALDMREGNPLQ